jgi:hypothetical protein
MKIVRVIFLVLGWICITINGLYFLTGSPTPKHQEIELVFAYYIGASSFAIVGLVFLLFAYLINKTIKQQSTKNLLDRFLEEEQQKKTNLK